MQFSRRIFFLIPLGLAALICTSSCEKETVTLGAEVIGGEPFNTDKAVYDVFAFNRKIEAVQTNKLPIYQLGVYQDSIYGRTEARITTQLNLQGGLGNPTFGLYSQSVEDNADNDDNDATIAENERVKEVVLYIPFLQNPSGDRDGDGVPNALDLEPDDPNNDNDGDTLGNSQETLQGTNPLDADTDGDGINDNEDDETAVFRFPNRIDLDSIYGDRTQEFTLKVERSTFFLRDLDPAANFEQAQEYYSTQQFAPSFVSDVLFEGDLQISDEEILIFAEDEPDTEEDESAEAPERLPPGIRVQLDTLFWQENFLDLEGKTELLSAANFNEFMRGIHLSLTPTKEELLILFDLTRASLDVTYEFDRIEEDTLTVEERTYTLNLITGGGNTPVFGNAVNSLITDVYPVEITDAMDTDSNAARIYLKGGAGSYAEIHLFEELPRDDMTQPSDNTIKEIRANNWIINEANLVLYLDRDVMDNIGVDRQPPRLYLYNTATNEPLYNVVNEQSVADSPFGLFLDYDGFLETEDDQGIKYTFRITEHINDLIVREEENVILGLTLTPDIRITGLANARLGTNTDQELPVASNISPLGTVLIGSDVNGAEANMKLQLEISYTETN